MHGSHAASGKGADPAAAVLDGTDRYQPEQCNWCRR